MVLVDSNVIIDLFEQDPDWWPWSVKQMRDLQQAHTLTINAIIYAELAASHTSMAALDQKLSKIKFQLEAVPRQAAFLAGKAFVQYKKQGGTRTNVLSDFFIGAHAEFENCALLTRDPRRYRAYFPSVRLITPIS